ncbi:MAG: sulfotransferase family protein [Hyphomonadaceae bacterium]
MALQVIGAGVGRTGTYSLKLALNQLGFGPCHHMEEVILNMPRQLPLWSDVLNGAPDWEAVFAGYHCTVDWPTARYFRELLAAYPSAKFILTQRSPRSWAESFQATIYALLSRREQAPEPMRAWLAWASSVIAQTGFPAGLDTAGLERAFLAHNEAVKAAIPPDQLLVYQVKDGWGPLCAFLGAPAPSEPFPRTNDRSEFWDRVAQAS